MKKIQFYLILICLNPFSAIGQTWNGSISSDWNTANNWTPSLVPSSSGVVIINQVLGVSFTPKLSADVSVGSITMNAGSILDVNGYSITTSEYFRTNGTLPDPVVLNNSTPANNIIINMNGNATTKYLRGTQFNGKVNLNTNTTNSFTIGNGANICSFTDDVAIQSSGTGDLNISTNSTNLFSGALTIDMLQAASLNLFTTADTSKVLGNFVLTNLNGGATSFGNTGKTTTISGKVNINYNADGLNSAFSLLNIKNSTSGGQVFIKNPGGSTIISKDTLLLNDFSVTNYNATPYYHDFRFYNNSISGNTTLSDSSTNVRPFYLGGNNIGGNYTIINNGNSDFNESNYGGNTIAGDVLYIKNGTATFKANSNGVSAISGDYTFQCNNIGTVQLFITDTSTIGGNFSLIDSVGADTKLGNQMNTTLISGKVDIDYNSHAAHNQFEMYQLKNLGSGGSIAIQNTGKSTILLKDTLVVDNISITDYTASAYYHDFRFYYNSISGNTTISDSSVNVRPFFLGGNNIGGDYTIKSNGTGVINESNYGGNSIAGNVIYFKNGSAPFTTGSNTVSNIAGDYTFQCKNGVGNVRLFIDGITAIGGNFKLIDSVGANTQVGNNSTTSLISGKVDIDYNSNTLNNPFVMYKMKNMINGGSVAIQNTGLATDISRDTLMVTDFSITDYNADFYSVNFYFYNNSISGNATISDAAANGRNLYLGGNSIGGNYTITYNGAGVLNESYYGGNSITGNVIYFKNGTGPFTTGSNTVSNIAGDYTFQCKNGAGNVRLFIDGTTAIGGNFKLIDSVGTNTQLGNNTTTTLISGKVDIHYNSNTLNNPFVMYKMKNMINGGSVAIQNTGLATNISSDTLMVTDFSITDYNADFYSVNFYFYNNSISGNTTISDAAANVRNLYLGGNSIGGNYMITSNGAGALNESYYGGNSIAGNAIYFKNGTASFTTGSNTISNIAGDYTFQCKNGTGNIRLFIDGTTAIGGNFKLVDSVGANTQIGNLVNTSIISGKVDIDYNSNNLNNPFVMYKMKNLGSGGSVNIQNAGQTTNISNDTLLVNDFSITYKANVYSYNLFFYNNSISGNTSISDSATNGRPLYIGGNIIGGNYNLTGNGAGAIYESYPNSNQCNGNATFINNGSAQMTIGYSQNSKIKSDFNVTISNLLNLNAVELNGDSNTTINQLGSNSIAINKLTINKSNGAKLLLSFPILINSNVEFLNGDIKTEFGKELIFADNASVTNPSDSSKVLGPVSKIGNDAFMFPIGSLNKYTPLGISAPGNVADKFTADYIRKNATLDGLDTALRASTLDRVSGDYYFDLKRDNGTSNVKVSVGYNTVPGAITNPVNLRVAHWNGLIWEDLGNGSITGNNIEGTVTTAIAVGSFSPFALATIDAMSNPLPLKILDFSAKKASEAIQLNWEMASDEEIDNYIIEKSNNGINFSRIGDKLSSKSKEQIKYAFTDIEPFDGNNFYRVKLLKKEDKYLYSRIVVVSMNKEHEITLSPNPTNDYIKISNARIFKEYSIFDQNGRTVLSGKISVNEFQINVDNLKTGVYFIRLWNDSKDKKIKFIKGE